MPTDPDADVEGTPTPLGTRLALWVFVAYVAFAFPYLILGPGDYHWFLRDEWVFFTERRGLSLRSLFEPFGAHLVALPALAYIVLWNIFGASTYVPYQASVVGLHLTAAVLLRVVMRRSGVAPWIATAAASLFVLFGPGAQNILWAFQIGFTGALVLGLTQILLADHDGGVDWRDGLGVAAGVLAVMSTGVGISMVIAAGAAAFLRRGWKVAILYVAPAAVTFGVWALVEHPDTTGPFGRPSAGEIVDFAWNGVVGTFTSMGHYRPIAVVMVVVLIAGAAVSWAPTVGAVARRFNLEPEAWRDLSRRWALPAGLLVGAGAFLVFTAIGRTAFQGAQGARASRYMHLTAACTLPALAVAADALARRWRLLTIPLIALFLIPIPANLDHFTPAAFGPNYMFQREQVLSNVIRMPFAREVPRDVRPIPDPFDGNLTIGFLLDAHDEGRFPASDSPIPAALRNELRIRLGLAQRTTEPGSFPFGCEQHTTPVDLSPHKGDQFNITTPVRVVTLDEGSDDRPEGVATSGPVDFKPANGTEFTAELAGLDLRLRPAPKMQSFTVCGL